MAQVQPMGIAKGLIEFTGKSAEVTAYCLDLYAHAPYSGTRYTQFNAPVTVTRTNGSVLNVRSLDDLVKQGYIEVRGVGNNIEQGMYDRLRFVKTEKGRSIQSINLESEAIARTRNYSKSSYQELDQLFSSEIVPFIGTNRQLHQYLPQELLWLRQEGKDLASGLRKNVVEHVAEHVGRQELLDQFNLLKKERSVFSTSKKPVRESELPVFVNQPNESGRVLAKTNYDPNHNLDINYIQLEDGGNSFVVKTPEKELLIFDTGKTKKDAARLQQLIKSSGDDITSAKVFITHTDADHINGLKRWLKDDVKIDQIIVSDMYSSKNGAKQFEKFKAQLEKCCNYTQSSLGEGLAISFSQGVNDISLEAIPMLSNTTSASKVRFSSGDQLVLFKKRSSSQVNDLSMISRFEHNGVSHLSMGDAGTSSIRSVLSDVKAQKALHDRKIGDLQQRILDVEDEIESLTRDLNLDYNSSVIDDIQKSIGDELAGQFGEEHKELIDHLIRKNKLIVETLESGRLPNIDLLKSYEDQLDGLLSKLDIEDDLITKALKKHTDAYNTRVAKLDALSAERETLIESLASTLEKADPLVLESTIVQWPHHHWLPDLTVGTNKQVLDEFLNTTNPQYLILSNPPKGVKQSLNNLMDYLNKFKAEYGKAFEIILLDEHFKVISLNDYLFESDSHYYDLKG